MGVRIFFVLFRSWVTCKNKKRLGFYTLTEPRFFTFLLITIFLITFELRYNAHITCKWKISIFDEDEALENNKNS